MLDKNGVICDFIGDPSLIFIHFKNLIGHNIQELFLEGKKQVLKSTFERTFSSRQTQSVEISLNSENLLKIFECKFILYNNVTVLMVVRDVSKQKIVELKLNDFKSSYQAFIENLDGIAYQGYEDFSAVFFHGAIEKITGYKESEFLDGSIRWDSIIHPKDRDRVNNIVKEFNNSNRTSNSKEYRIIRKDGDIRWVLTRYRKFYDEINKKNGTRGIIFDITERKAAERQLKESEGKYRMLYDKAPFGIALFNLEGVIVDCNRELETITGYTSEELLNRNFLDFSLYVQPEDQNYQERKELLDRGISPLDREVQLFKKDGNQFWAKTQINRIQLSDGMYIQAIIQDITEKKVAEEKLKESEENYRFLVENAQEGIWTIDTNAKTTYTNERMAEMLGYTVDEMLGKQLFDFMDEQSVTHAKQQLELRRQGVKQTYLRDFIRKDGNNITTSLETAPILNKEGKYLGAIACVIDITEHKKAEEKLKESEEKFRTITEQSLTGIAILQDDIFKYMNQQFAEIYAYSVEELTSKPNQYVKITHPDDRDFVIDQATKKQKGIGDVIQQYQFRGLKKTGETIWIEILSKTITYNGKLADLLSIIDITERKDFEEKLRESEEKFRNIAEQTFLGIMIVQEDGPVKYVNQGMADMYGYSIEEALSWNPFDVTKVIAPESLKTVMKYRKSIKDGNPAHFPMLGMKKSGEKFWVDHISKIISYNGKRAELISQVDINDRMNLQQELIKLNNLKSELLRRTSHELKTPLVSIKGFTQLILSKYGAAMNQDMMSMLLLIKDGCTRLQNLIQDILEVSKLESGKSRLNKTTENLAFLIRYTVNSLQPQLTFRGQTLTLNIHENLTTKFEKEKLYEVLANLLSNAIKYTPQKGKIEVKTEIEGDFFKVSVKDNGIGITPEEKEQIFQQFGKIERFGQGHDVISEGSGLGLYICKKIIELHAGKIWVESEGRNKGSTFYFTIPIIKV